MDKSTSMHSKGATAKGHNQRLAALLVQVSQDIEAANSQDGLIEAIEQVKAFNGPLAFNHRGLKCAVAAALIAALLLGGYAYYVYRHLSEPTVVLMVVLGLGALGMSIYMWRKSSRIRALAERLYQRDLLFDNQLREMGDDLPELEKRLFTDFYEFNRGNYSRELSAGYEGQYQGETYGFSYFFITFTT